MLQSQPAATRVVCRARRSHVEQVGAASWDRPSRRAHFLLLPTSQAQLILVESGQGSENLIQDLSHVERTAQSRREPCYRGVV